MTDIPALTRADIERLRELHANATPGPWIDAKNNDGTVPFYASGILESLPDGRCVLLSPNPNYVEKGRRNAALVTAARNALPALLDAAERGLRLCNEDWRAIYALLQKAGEPVAERAEDAAGAVSLSMPNVVERVLRERADAQARGDALASAVERELEEGPPSRALRDALAAYRRGR